MTSNAIEVAMTADQIEERLKKAYPDSDLAVIDTNGDGYHFDVRIASENFKGKTRIKQHQEVMAVFDDELKSGELHALSLKTLVKE